MNRLVVALCVLLGILTLAPPGGAAVPHLINYQGLITDTGGLAIDGKHNLTFKIYPDTVTATPLWTEQHDSVDVNQGVFSVILGSVTAIPDSLFANRILACPI